MTVAVEIWREWDAVAWQSEGSTPVGGDGVALVWRSEPPLVDAGVPDVVSAAIAEVLVELGRVAFRWPKGVAVPPEARRVAAPARGLAGRAKDWLAKTWPADLVVTRSAAVARELFAHDWDMQGQAVLVLDAEGDIELALSALRVNRDWRPFIVASPVVALLVPLADGDGAALTTDSRARTEAVLARLAQAFAAGGVTMSSPA